MKPATQVDFSDPVLKSASLFNSVFSIDWLIQVLNEKPSEIIRSLETATAQGVLKKKEFSSFYFTRRSDRNNIRASIPKAEKKLLLNKISDILLTELPDNVEKADQLAGILLESDNNLQQCRWLAKAADTYNRSFRVKNAIHCFEKVLHDLSVIEGEASSALYIETVLKYSRISDMEFDIQKIMAVLKQALEMAEERHDLKSAALVQMHMAKNEWYRSNYPEALRLFNKGWEISQSVNDPKFESSALNFAIFFHYWQGFFQEAVDLYESKMTQLDESLFSRFQLMTDSVLGHCYTMIGQAAHGFGMISTTRSQCERAGDSFMAAFNALTMAISLIDIQRFGEAAVHIRTAAKEGKKWPNSPLSMIVSLLEAYVNFRKDEIPETVKAVRKFISLRETIKVSMWPYPYLFEICWAMETDRFPKIAGLTLQHEIDLAKNSQNMYMIGIAQRFTALLGQKNGNPAATLSNHLKQSEAGLKKSGHVMELLRTWLALYQVELTAKQAASAESVRQKLSSRLSGIPLTMIPPDLLPFKTGEEDLEDLSQSMGLISEKIMTISDPEILIHHLITASNRMLGAERGAVFLLDEKSKGVNFHLYGARNLTNDQIDEGVFKKPLDLIERVIQKGEGMIESYKSENKSIGEPIHSLICVPLMLKGQKLGALYHDNRMLLQVFDDHHLKRLNTIAAMVSIVVKNQILEKELSSILKGTLSDRDQINDNKEIVGHSAGINRVLEAVSQVAQTDSTVLVLGETGVGKELVAKAIHKNSDRNDGPFISVNCNALPDSLISSELFGHEKGAFTDARQRRIGRFEMATGGTLFLDEIGELPFETQVKLLRVLQSREFERIGGTQTIRSDFRLITATNRNLSLQVEKGRFRSDLFYRLNIFPVTVPPLRTRKEDIPLLARHFLQKHSLKIGKRFASFPEKEMEKLVDYEWFGNVRELENVIERGIIASHGSVFTVPDLTESKDSPFSETETESGLTLKEMERRHIINTLNKTLWKVRGSGGAAELLNINASTLYSRMKKLGLKRGG